MASFVIATPVAQSLAEVKAGFTERLFLALNPPPPFPKVELLRFDGCKTGDTVILKLHFPFFSQEWESLIVHDEESNELWLFIDSGKRLPFFLSSWKHKHLVKVEKGQTIIYDDITFGTPWWLPSLLMAPLLKFQFGMRKPIYQRFFGKP